MEFVEVVGQGIDRTFDGRRHADVLSRRRSRDTRHLRDDREIVDQHDPQGRNSLVRGDPQTVDAGRRLSRNSETERDFAGILAVIGLGRQYRLTPEARPEVRGAGKCGPPQDDVLRLTRPNAGR